MIISRKPYLAIIEEFPGIGLVNVSVKWWQGIRLQTLPYDFAGLGEHGATLSSLAEAKQWAEKRLDALSAPRS